MLFRQIYDEDLAHASYLVGCQRSREAIVVDPSRDIDRYVELARRHGLRIVAVAETHIHADFLSGAQELAVAVGARVYVSDEGGIDWNYGWIQDYDATKLRHGDSFSIGKIEFRAVHTPGHTPEHLSYLVTDFGGGANRPMGMLSGDFVFVGDLGRPDLLETAAGVPGVKEASARSLYDSTQTFLQLEDFLQVWPAHGAGSSCGKALGAVPQSTVGYERRFNPALGFGEEEQPFVDYILADQPEPPLYFGRMKVQNRDGVPRLGELPQPTELDLGRAQLLDPEAVTILDMRSWSAFRQGHLPGALYVPDGAAFFTVAGSYVQPESHIVLVSNPDEVELHSRRLVRIGIDRVMSFVTPKTVELVEHLEVVPEVSPSELNHELRELGAQVLDVRRAAEVEAGKISDEAIQIAHTRLPRHVNQLDTHRPVYVHCASGVRSAAATAYLRRQGFDAINLRGGFAAWRRHVEPADAVVAGD